MKDHRRKVKVTLRLYEEDVETLKTFFPTGGYNAAIRNMVNRLVKELQKKTSERLSALEMASGPESIDVGD